MPEALLAHRRTALALLGQALLAALTPARAQTPAATNDDIAWLDRLTWGATPRELQALQQMGRERWLQAQLHPAAPAALPAAVQAAIDAMTVTRTPLPELLRSLDAERKAADALADDAQKAAARKALQQRLNGLAREAASRMLLRAVYSPQQLREQLTWFWFNHFNVHQAKHALRAAVADYEDVLRAHALGRFRDLLRASALHPAMLVYLDNARNAAGRINENYARELLELHTLGVDGGYTQRDVQELARVLTGLGVRLEEAPPHLRPALRRQAWHQGLVEFNPRRHDFGDKLLLGQTVRGGGIDEIEQVLDRLAQHPSTARFVSRKLAVHFVADEPPPELVERLQRRFQQTDGDIAEVMRALVGSPEFGAALGKKFKDPLHYVVSATRLLHDGDDRLVNTGPLLAGLARLGELPYNRQTPDGYPLDRQAWASPGQMNTRFEVARGLAGAAVSGSVPPRAEALYREPHAGRLSEATRQVLAQAAAAPEWNALLLASPEFMYR
jgi:uncharacterized protein (DUF1800 family)